MPNPQLLAQKCQWGPSAQPPVPESGEMQCGLVYETVELAKMKFFAAGKSYIVANTGRKRQRPTGLRKPKAAR